MNDIPQRSATARWLRWALPLLLLAGAAFLFLDLGKEDRALVDVVPAKFDFGRVRFGVNQVARFRIRNNSDQAVTVRSVRANCSCFTVRQQPTRRLSAGEETEIVLEMRSAMTAPTKFRGKRLSIETDHPRASIVQVALEGEIFAPYWIEPKTMHVGMVGDDDADFEERRIAVHQERGFEVGLETRLEGYEGGWRADDPQLVDVKTEPTEDGVAFLVRLRREGYRGVNQIRSGITMALRVRGKDMPEEQIFKRMEIHGNWVPRTAAPGGSEPKPK
jgi:hypothetical protein